MKQIVVISGKGGTGKTTFTASLATFLKNSVMIDADVDASNMPLLIKCDIKKSFDFYGGEIAYINKDKCISCHKCIDVCRFDAISEDYIVSRDCEGCRFCYNVCPEKAIEMKQRYSGKWFVSDTEHGKMFHARLEPGEENSGKLVSKIKEEALKYAKENNVEFLLVDGPPGTGCPVMASLSGADIAVVITEPTLSGISDAKRIMDVLDMMGIKYSLVINKYDINPNNSNELEDIVKNKKSSLLGKIPFDENVQKSIEKAEPVVKVFPDSAASVEIKNIYDKIIKLIQ